MITDRRALMLAGGALMAAPTFAAAEARPKAGAFPQGFLWGAATAGHQAEGNNVNSDLWVLETVKPSVFADPSGDADNSLELWPQDLDLVRDIGLNSYRFSLEWARIEPEPGVFSLAMLDHYKAMIEGCHARGLTPVVTYNHYTAPRWFAVQGGWTNPQAPGLFARFCERATRHLGAGIGYATTLNEPNILQVLSALNLPPPLIEGQRAMLAAAARATNSPKFVSANVANAEDIPLMLPNLLAGHKAGRQAIKAVRPDLPVGVSLAMFDDQAAEPGSRRDAVREALYGPWLEAVKGDDFLGVQNYERSRIDAQGRRLPPPPGATLNWSGAEVYAPSLAGAVRYAHQATGVPILVTEHGVGTDDDRIRAALIPAALAGLKAAMDDGVPVKGYIHWSLLDNFEWIFGFKPHYGLASVDRATFRRTPKPSAAVLGAIARRNAL